MRKSLFVIAAALAVSLPADATAQLGVAARIGTWGLGGEGSIALSHRFVLRGGGSISKLETNTTFSDVPVTVSLPETWWNVGVDFYFNSAFRLGGGIAFKPKDPTLRGNFTESVEIGGELLTPTQIGTLTGTVDSDNKAAYFLLGFGKHTDPGVGLFFDAGVVVLGSPTVRLQAQDGTYPQDQLDALLAVEAVEFEDNMKTYLKVWPILSLGLRIGIAY